MQFEKKNKKKTLLLKYCCRFDIFIYSSLICKLTVLHLHTLNKSQTKDDLPFFSVLNLITIYIRKPRKFWSSKGRKWAKLNWPFEPKYIWPLAFHTVIRKISVTQAFAGVDEKKVVSFRISITWVISWTGARNCYRGTIEKPLVNATSATVVGIITERRGPRGIHARSAPSTATLTISLTLRASLDFLKAYATHLNGLPRLRRTWLDLPSVTTSAASVVGVISEAVGPGRTGGPTSARAPGSLALWAPFCFFKTETVLHLRVDRPLCFNSPLVLAASTSIVGVVSKWFRPCRTVAPATARVRRSLTLRAAFSFFKADPKTPLTSPANWRPADD